MWRFGVGVYAVHGHVAREIRQTPHLACHLQDAVQAAGGVLRQPRAGRLEFVDEIEPGHTPLMMWPWFSRAHGFAAFPFSQHVIAAPGLLVAGEDGLVAAPAGEPRREFSRFQWPVVGIQPGGGAAPIGSVPLRGLARSLGWP